METNLSEIINQYKNDKESVYNTWFVNNDERLKAFRSIRRGVIQVIDNIKQKNFGNDFKGSSLEFVLSCITEQKQVFEGAAHPFYWKPKLRIPDIYENEANKIAFGQFLDNILHATKEDQIIQEIIKLDKLKIKGLGPAVASIAYFIHPTIISPSNTAIINGFNLLFKEKKKLGSWSDYLNIREVIIDTNKKYQRELSLDLGAFAGLLYEIGIKRILIGDHEYISDIEREKIELIFRNRKQKVGEENKEENIHSEMQYHLLKIGDALGYDRMCARNDMSKAFNGSNFSFLCLKNFPLIIADKDTLNTIQLVDVLWFKKGTNIIVAAFEVEKTTSIYSGILRLTDLAFTLSEGEKVFYIIIPDTREKEVKLQLTRPSIKNSKVPIKYILFSELRSNCDAICKFGDTHFVMDKIAKSA